jgi:hypothetical protein
MCRLVSAHSRATLVGKRKLRQTYLALGGSLDPEPDTQSPFYDKQSLRNDGLNGKFIANGKDDYRGRHK